MLRRGRRSWMSDAELGILHSNWRGMDTMLLVSILLKRQSKPQGRPWQAIHTLKVLGRYDMRCPRYQKQRVATTPYLYRACCTTCRTSIAPLLILTYC